MRKNKTSFIALVCLGFISINQSVTFANFSKSDNKANFYVFNINTEGYSYTVDTSSSDGICGVLYVNGEYIDNDVYWRYIAEGAIVYYQKKEKYNEVYRYDAINGQREMFQDISECFLEGCYKDKYLYYSSSKYSNDPTEPSVIVCDFPNKTEIAHIDQSGLVEVADNKIFTLQNTGVLYPVMIQMADPDGSNVVTIADDASEMKVIDNKLYYSAVRFDSDYKAQECVRRYDIASGNTVTLTDYFDGVVEDLYKYQDAYYNNSGNDSMISIIVNDQYLSTDQPPIIYNDRTLVPLRAIFEALGATVTWDGDTQTVTAQKGNTIIKLTIGSYELNKNNNSISIDVPSIIVNGRTLVPVRAVSEALDCKVDWNEATKTVFIKQIVDN